jgi:hypothetical protein
LDIPPLEIGLILATRIDKVREAESRRQEAPQGPTGLFAAVCVASALSIRLLFQPAPLGVRIGRRIT